MNESRTVIDTAATIVTRTDGSKEIGLVRIEQNEDRAKGTFVTPIELQHGDSLSVPLPLPYRAPPDASDN
jgi:hypothetical protein